ncbi:MAG: MgtC/SapB family protein [Muribaculaceae bacterium]
MPATISDTITSIYEAVNSVDITTAGAIYRMVLSMLLGSIVGYERKRKGQPAGVRTFALIAMGATLAMILSIYIPQEYLGLKNGDPGRIAAQVLSGIGFLGAGAIIQMKGSVKGLTTAAGIWMVATLGLAVGAGLYWISVAATALIMFVLVQIERLEHKTGFGAESRIVRIRLSIILHDIEAYRNVLTQEHTHLDNYYIEYDYVSGETRLNLVIRARENIDYLRLFERFEQLYPTISATLTNQLSF